MSTPITCQGLRRAFGDQLALAGVACEAPAGRFTAILGPSGSGKTTLLRVIAGLERADAGTVAIGETVVSDPAPRVVPRDRRIGMVFQSLGLWPHLTAERHITFVLRARGVAADTHAARVQELLTLVGLPDRAGARPAELSGGEQQRVALARALAGDPAVLLLDEPFGSLDAALRTRLRAAVREIQQRLNLTTVLVTHDQEEALAVADHLVVMQDGRVEQAGRPVEVYHRPATRFVAEFLGGATVVAGTVAGGTLTCPVGTTAVPGVADGAVQVVCRPEGLSLTESEGTAATVVASTFAAGRYQVALRLADDVEVRAAVDAPHAAGTALQVRFATPPHCIPQASA